MVVFVQKLDSDAANDCTKFVLVNVICKKYLVIINSALPRQNLIRDVLRSIAPLHSDHLEPACRVFEEFEDSTHIMWTSLWAAQVDKVTKTDDNLGFDKTSLDALNHCRFVKIDISLAYFRPVIKQALVVQNDQCSES